MIVCDAPNKVKTPGVSLFLAGSIEMGTAQNWQQEAIKQLEGVVDIIYNPRRPDWDSSWEQSKNNPQFTEQVQWELEYIMEADYVLFYFDPATKSPISLLELGYTAEASRIIVVCPEGFWRKGNVDILCDWVGAPLFETLEEAILHLKDKLQ